MATNRHFIFLACQKARFSEDAIGHDIIMKDPVVSILEMILVQVHGRKVMTNGSLSSVVLLPALLSRISALALVDSRSFPLLIGSLG